MIEYSSTEDRLMKISSHNISLALRNACKEIDGLYMDLGTATSELESRRKNFEIMIQRLADAEHLISEFREKYEKEREVVNAARESLRWIDWYILGAALDKHDNKYFAGGIEVNRDGQPATQQSKSSGAE